MYYVYVHTVPNGKMYIGKTKDLQSRWNNGEGYSPNTAFYKDILLYGWENIKHEIIAECIDNESASQMEAVLIALLKTENEQYGYNQTDIYKRAMKKFTQRRAVDDPQSRIYEKSCTFFEQYNLPLSACEEVIDQWIFSEFHRKVLKDRLLNDLSIDELSKKYGKAERTIKAIVRDGCNKLEKHL